MPWASIERKRLEYGMPLTTVIVAVVGVGVGVVVWLINRFIPMQGQIKSIRVGR
jgi:hypothetical protein